jgi:biopolymer transport protein ExbD
MTYFPAHRRKRRNSSDEVRLQLTSMMDMFTILLVFLLKSFSAQGQLINPSQDLTLPTSEVQHPPEVGLDVTVSADWILVNGKPVERTSEIQNSEGYVLPKLQAALRQYAREGRRMEEQYGTKFSGKVTIQGDKRLPYRLLIKVLATCGQTDFPNMRLVVYQEEG